MAGYVVQLRRALYRLAEVGAFDTVGVETSDDVGVIKASVLQFEQDKLSIGGQGVVNNRSEALWRTLDIWTDAWQQYSSGDKDLEFCFVTNRTCKGCLVRLSVEDRDAQENAAIADELEKERAEGEGDLQKLINAVLDKGKEVLVPVLERIRPQLGSQEFDSKLIETTIEKLHLSPDLVDPQVVYESLFGLAQTLVDLWMEKQPGMISRAAFDRQLGKITDKLNRARVTAERLGSLL